MEARLRLHFRIELLEMESVCGDVGGKADEMLFCHWVVQRHVPIALYPLDGKGVRVIRRLGLLGSSWLPQQLNDPSPMAWTTLPQMGHT